MSGIKAKASIRWLFNGRMIIGAILGCWIAGSIQHLKSTARHEGPGTVSYGDGDRYPEREEMVSEEEYKKRNFGAGWFLLGTGVIFWILAAKNARSEDNEKLAASRLGTTQTKND